MATTYELRKAIEVWQKGKPEDFTQEHVVEIIQNLYRLNLAEAFFAGLGWIEGYSYCNDDVYLAKTFAPHALPRYKLQLWWACRFLGRTRQKGITE